MLYAFAQRQRAAEASQIFANRTYKAQKHIFKLLFNRSCAHFAVAFMLQGVYARTVN
jgi:hypothetical protein